MDNDNNAFSRRHFGLVAAGAATLAGTRAFAQPASRPGDWLRMVRDQHNEVEAMFRQMERTQGARERSVLLRRIADALTGHAIAEEVALYPMIEILGMKRPSEELYDQQQDAKVLLARLDNGPKAGPAFLREFQTLASAVRAHVAEEEQEVYPMLRQRATRDQNMKMSMDFEREFRRYADSV